MSKTSIRLHFEPLADGGYVATSPDVPGLVAQGRNRVEAAEIAHGLVQEIIESCIQHGEPIPPALAGM